MFSENGKIYSGKLLAGKRLNVAIPKKTLLKILTEEIYPVYWTSLKSQRNELIVQNTIRR